MNFLEGATVGIDLGTTYSTMAQLNSNGVPESLRNAENRPITPSVVLLGEDGHIVVGPTYDRIAQEEPERVIEAIKRQMGNKNYFVVYQDKKLTPEFISALIIKKLKQDSEKRVGTIANAVVTVPYYFNDVRRKATQDAGRIAGLNIIDIINEPTAATLAYAWIKGELGREDKMSKEKNILVYDLGGGTFDVTAVRYDPTHFRVLATDGDVMLGGLDWSRRIVDHVAEQFKQKFGSDPREDNVKLREITQDCEDAKRLLSKSLQVPITVYHEGKTLTVSLTRKDFERMTADLMQRTRDTTELVLQQANLNHGELDEVVLVGGSTYMPLVEVMLKESTGRAPTRDLPADEAVAHGAAIHAAILEARLTGGEGRMAQSVIKRLMSVQTYEVNSHSLGVKISDPNDKTRKINHIMIPRNTTIPYSYKQQFVTTSHNQQRIHIWVLEGEVPDPNACSVIGDFVISDLPAELPAGSPVELTYSYDANGRITVAAREVRSNRAAHIEIKRDSGLDNQGITAFEKLAKEYTVE
ncbi:MAG: Hsp70 family protein [Planctomycetota bacterium]|nr:Hsp70 family protein [Planctomycetota bacterium]